MGAEVVQGLLGPRAVGELGDERARQRDGLIVLAELAQRAQVEETRLGLAGGLFEIRLHAVARRSVALQEEVALGNAQVGELPVVAGHLPLDVLERAARLGVALRAEQDQRAAQVALALLRMI